MFNPKKKSFWNDRNHYLFLSIWRNHANEIQVANTKQKLMIFNDMCEELKELDIKVKPLDIERKISNFTIKYAQMRDAIDKGEMSASDWILYSKVDKIIGAHYLIDNPNDDEDTTNSGFFSIPSPLTGMEQDESGDDSSDSDGFRKYSKQRKRKLNTRRRPFNDNELKIFIDVWRKYLIESARSRKNVLLYKKMSTELAIKGINLLPTEVKNQIFNLISKYKRLTKLIEANEPFDSWPFYDFVGKLIELKVQRGSASQSVIEKICKEIKSIPFDQIDKYRLDTNKADGDGDADEVVPCPNQIERVQLDDTNSGDIDYEEILKNGLDENPIEDASVEEINDSVSKFCKAKLKEEEVDEEHEFLVEENAKEANDIIQEPEVPLEEDPINVPKRRKMMLAPSQISSRLTVLKPPIRKIILPISNASTPYNICSPKVDKQNTVIEKAFVETWSKNLKDFFDPKKRLTVHRNIADALKEYGLQLTKNEVANNIKMLITKYRRISTDKLSAHQKLEWTLYDDVHKIMKRHKHYSMLSKLSPEALCSDNDFSPEEDEYQEKDIFTDTINRNSKPSVVVNSTDNETNKNLVKALNSIQQSQNLIAALVMRQTKATANVAESLNKFIKICEDMRDDNKKLVNAVVNRLSNQ